MCCSSSSGSGSSISPYYYQQIDLQVFNCGSEVKIVPFTFERIGHTVTVTHDRFYDDEQISGYMFTELIPEVFRPSKTIIKETLVIDSAVDYGINHQGLTYTGTATRAVGPGTVQFNGANIMWGPRRPNNDESFLMFSNNGTTGSGSGVLAATHIYSI